jgi:DNA-binding HxlR family transcriptional regulator
MMANMLGAKPSLSVMPAKTFDASPLAVSLACRTNESILVSFQLSIPAAHSTRPGCQMGIGWSDPRLNFTFCRNQPHYMDKLTTLSVSSRREPSAMEYGQFCPIAKASEIIGEKWTILIVREIMMGGSRFSDLQRGLGTISPTLLTRRLTDLEARGMIIKKKIQGRRGFEYFPTESCKELKPILLSLGNWGMRWARSHLTAKDYDVELLMLYLQRSILPEKLPGVETVIRFAFTDMTEKAHWWIVVRHGDVDICDQDPGKDVDLFFTTTVRTMVDIWTGIITYRKAVASDNLSIIGPTGLTNNVTTWMSNSIFTDLPSAREI